VRDKLRHLKDITCDQLLVVFIQSENNTLQHCLDAYVQPCGIWALKWRNHNHYHHY